MSIKVFNRTLNNCVHHHQLLGLNEKFFAKKRALAKAKEHRAIRQLCQELYAQLEESEILDECIHCNETIKISDQYFLCPNECGNYFCKACFMYSMEVCSECSCKDLEASIQLGMELVQQQPLGIFNELEENRCNSCKKELLPAQYPGEVRFNISRCYVCSSPCCDSVNDTCLTLLNIVPYMRLEDPYLDKIEASEIELRSVCRECKEERLITCQSCNITFYDFECSDKKAKERYFKCLKCTDKFCVEK